MIIQPRKVSRPYYYLPDGWDDGWKTAKAAGAASLLIQGDSFSQGFDSTDNLLKGYPWLFRTALVSAGQAIKADYFPVVMGSGYPGLTGYAGTSLFTFAASSTANTRGLLSSPWWTGATSNIIVFTSPYACTDMDIIWLEATTGTPAWSYTVDGGGSTNVNATNSGFNKRTQINGLSSAVHTINFSQALTQGLWLEGVICYPNGRSATGISFANNSISGKSMANYQGSGSVPVDLITQFQGIVDGSTKTGFGFPTQPHLGIVALGVNDCQVGTVEATYRDGLRRFCQAFRRGQRNASILFAVMPAPDAVNSDHSTNFTNSANYADQFIASMYRVAHEFNCGVVNVHAAVGETPETDGLFTVTKFHTNDTGHAFIANMLAQIV